MFVEIYRRSRNCQFKETQGIQANEGGYINLSYMILLNSLNCRFLDRGYCWLD